MPGYNRPEGGWTFAYDGINTVDAPDQLNPTQYPIAVNIRSLPDHHVETRPGYERAFQSSCYLSLVEGGETLETEITTFTYGMAVQNGSHTFARSSKYIQPSRIPNAVYQLESVYLNQQTATDMTVQLIAPDSTVAATINLPPTGPGAGIGSLTRYRDPSTFTLDQDGAYLLNLITPTNAQGILYDFKLIPTQTRANKTVIHFPMLIGVDPRYADLGGIAGGDLFRTTSTVYVEGDSFVSGRSVDKRFPYFYYVASEWVGLTEILFEMLTDGFAPSEYMALFDAVSGVMVPGSENVNGSTVATTVVSIDPAELVDGHYYVVKCKSGSGSANAFFYGAWLHFVVEQSGSEVRGNAYYKIGSGSPGYYRTKPPTGDNARMETMYLNNNTQPNTYILGCGTTDVGAGSQIAPTIVPITYTQTEKSLSRSPFDINVFLPVGDRYYSYDQGGNEMQSFIMKSFGC